MMLSSFSQAIAQLLSQRVQQCVLSIIRVAVAIVCYGSTHWRLQESSGKHSVRQPCNELALVRISSSNLKAIFPLRTRREY